MQGWGMSLSPWAEFLPHFTLQPCLHGDIHCQSLGLARVHGHPWLTQSVFNSHEMESCQGMGKGSPISMEPAVHSLPWWDSPLPVTAGPTVYVGGGGRRGGLHSPHLPLSISKSLLSLSDTQGPWFPSLIRRTLWTEAVGMQMEEIKEFRSPFWDNSWAYKTIAPTYKPILCVSNLSIASVFLSESLLKQRLISFQADGSLGWTRKVTLQLGKRGSILNIKNTSHTTCVPLVSSAKSPALEGRSLVAPFSTQGHALALLSLSKHSLARQSFVWWAKRASLSFVKGLMPLTLFIKAIAGYLLCARHCAGCWRKSKVGWSWEVCCLLKHPQYQPSPQFGETTG